MARTNKKTKNTGGGKGLAALLAFLAGCSFGVGGAVSQIAKSQGFEVVQICFAQFLCATIILGILVLVRFRPKMSRKEMLELVILGMISSISSFTYYVAIDLLSVSAGVAIQFQYVWIAVAIQSIVEHKLPGKWTVISALFIIVGSVFGSGLADEIIAGGMTMDPLGLACALICALFYAIFIYMNGRVAVKHHAVTRSFFEVIGGLVFALVALMFSGGFAFDMVAIIPWGIIMGIIMSILPVVFIVTASSKISGSLVAILSSSELPMAVVAGFLMLGQSVSPLSIIGVVIILASICLSQLDNKKKDSANNES